MRVVLAFILGMVAIEANAGDWLVVSGYAHHLKGDHCNSVTTGIGYEHSHSGSVRTQVGFYRNSNCRWSAYAAQAWLPLQFADWRVGVIGGAVTGYNSTVTPAGGLAIAYEGKRYGMNLVGIPPAGDSSPGVIWIQAKFKW